VNAVHVQRLIETGGEWPPLLVHRSQLAVIDGAHRLAAAQALGLPTVDAVLFEGSDDEARIEAIRCNRGHGLPLTLADRKKAAVELISCHLDWSDGRVADICSLSPKTVAALRRVTADPDAEVPDRSESGVRIGRDGKRHPTAANSPRERVVRALSEDPGGSLRAIASRVGVSPETVRTVRRDLAANRSRPDRADSSARGLPTIDPDLFNIGRARVVWSRDQALASTEEGARFAAWFDRFDVDEGTLWEHPSAVPKSRTYEVTDEARRRARFWSDFADRVEGRR
jgi:hypothetical protein